MSEGRGVTMEARILDSHQARAKWRDVLDVAGAGASDVVVERYGKPVVAVIPYEDYAALQEELDELRAARRATAIYEQWKRDPSISRPYTEFRAELVGEGVLDDADQTPPAGTDNPAS
jgi:prevent-host-death family protein